MHSAELLELLLTRRNITSEEKDIFLKPSYERGLHDPYLMRDMERAVVRIYEAVEAKEKIVIYCDYDCDGIPAAVIMHDFFKKIGYENFSIYIPDRHDEGYGLHALAVEGFITEGVKLLITIDLGISAVKEVATAEASGMNVIILDHHLPKTDLPRAYAILNPKREGDTYPFKELCGAGIAFKLVQGLITKYGEYWKISRGWEKWLLDMAGLATLSDMVELRGENRVLAYYGLLVLKQSRRPGLMQLFHTLKIDARHLTEDDMTFMISPRLNAASRMDSPMRAFELLSESDVKKAGALATHLGKINDERKVLVAGIMKEAYKHLEKRELKEVIVIGNPSWRVGVLGLVASKISEEYTRPVFAWGREGTNGGSVIKGSCRSDGSASVVALMSATTDMFLEFGGHALSGGFTISEDNIHSLEDSLAEIYKNLPRLAQNENSKYDVALSLADVNPQISRTIETLAPFGIGNEKPVFLFPHVTIKVIKLFGKEKNHLELMLTDGDHTVKAISFFATVSSYDVLLEVGKEVDVIATIENSHFGGRQEVRLRIVDIL